MPPATSLSFRSTDCARGLILPLAGIGLVTNLSVLVVPLFMMQVFNRVVGTGNLHTLALLALAAIIALGGVAAVSVFRDQAIMRFGNGLRLRLERQRKGDGRDAEIAAEIAALHDLCIHGSIHAVVSLLWVPLLLVVLAMQHWLLALVALLFGVAIHGLGALQRWLGEGPSRAAARARAEAAETVATLSACGEARNSMQIAANLAARRDAALVTAAREDWHAQRLRSLFGSGLEFLRALAQLALIACGVVLLVDGGITLGGTIAASLIGAKTVALLEGGLRALSDLPAARAALRRIDAAVDAPVRTDIPDLSGAIAAEGLVVPRAPGHPPRLDRVSFSLAPGECLAVLGDSGSGKTSLLHCLAGVAHAPIGSVRLDQTDIRVLPPERLARMIGYLPQGAGLLRGTIAENIARWAPERDDATVIAAARAAGAHAFISSLPEAYDTRLPEARALISPGQTQRIALARALYGQPRILVLDEPNALLDPLGERLLHEALARLKAEGCTILMSLHRGSIIGLADRILVLDRGRISDLGPRREVMDRLDGGRRQISLPVTEAAEDDLADWLATQFRRAEDSDLRAKTIRAGRDLFAFARANGPNTATRRLTIAFAFLDDTSCMLTLSEPRRTQLQAKIEGVRRRLRDPAIAPDQLPDDEARLARLLVSAEKFDFRSTDRSSMFSATLRGAGAEGGRLQ